MTERRSEEKKEKRPETWRLAIDGLTELIKVFTQKVELQTVALKLLKDQTDNLDYLLKEQSAHIDVLEQRLRQFNTRLDQLETKIAEKAD